MGKDALNTIMDKYYAAYDKLKLHAVKNKLNYHEALTKAIKLYLKEQKA